MFRMRHMLRTSHQAREEGPLTPPEAPAQQVPVEAHTQQAQPTAAPANQPSMPPAPAPELVPAPSVNDGEPLLPPVDNSASTLTPAVEATAVGSDIATDTAEDEIPSEQNQDKTREEIPPHEAYRLLVAAANHVFEQASKEEQLDSDKLVPALNHVLHLFAKDDQLLTEGIRQRTTDTPRAQRVANTVLLAIRLGLEIEYNETQSLALGLCTLTHDIGMLTIPEEVLDSPKLTADQLSLLRNHPIQSQEMVKHFGEEYEWISEIVVQVHERHDGSGYPAGLKGENIHEFARIIGLGDMYEALGHPRSDRKAHVIYSALTTIIDTRNKHFDPRLIKALINIVSIFPLGSLVKLNNNQIGRVVGANKLYPTRPLVEVLLDHRGKPVKEALLVHLEEEPMLYIVDPAMDESVLEGK
ncbi:MAG: HD-GYP domain-containing protein (c-di-GMP phosphodiesterase class II) [Candidatus Latescibacterota bacterium]